jgi:uncharacterized membrane-anchored protein
MNGAVHPFALFGTLLLLAVAFAARLGLAADKVTPADAEAQGAIDAAVAAQIVGPQRIDLLDQAVIDLPAGYAFVPMAEAKRLVTSWGDDDTERLVGIIWNKDWDGFWWITVNFAKIGYVKDTGAKSWEPDRLLDRIRAIAEKESAGRDKQDSEVTVVGWIEPLRYDAATRRVSGAIHTVHKEAGSDDAGYVHSGVDALGRDGYFLFLLTTTHATYPEHGRHLHRVMPGFLYRLGKRYTDFDPATDPVSKHDLGAVVTGEAE